MQGIENGGPLLMVDSVTKRYKLPSGYEVEALGGISLELIKGEMLAGRCQWVVAMSSLNASVGVR
jgi:hypothetical protein